MKLSRIDILIYLLLFICIISLPVGWLKLPLLYELIILIGVRLLLLGIFIYKICKNKIKVFGNCAIKELLIFLPFFLICFSNIFASLFGGGFLLSETTILILFLQIFLCLLSAILEEIVFRLFIHNSLDNYSPLKRIIVGAFIFAICHFINVLNVRSINGFINLLLQTLYTFGLGLVLGFIYEYSHSLTFVVILHFVFNLLNDILYRFFGGYTTRLAFILTAVGITVLAAAYGITLYIFKFRKKEIQE